MVTAACEISAAGDTATVVRWLVYVLASFRWQLTSNGRAPLVAQRCITLERSTACHAAALIKFRFRVAASIRRVGTVSRCASLFAPWDLLAFACLAPKGVTSSLVASQAIVAAVLRRTASPWKIRNGRICCALELVSTTSRAAGEAAAALVDAGLGHTNALAQVAIALSAAVGIGRAGLFANRDTAVNSAATLVQGEIAIGAVSR